MITLLLEYSNKLDLNARDEVLNTPLHLAMEEGNVEVIKKLLDAGADRYLENRDKQKPTDLAKPSVLKIIAEWLQLQ